MKLNLISLGADEETAKKIEAAIAEKMKDYITKYRFDEVNSVPRMCEGDPF